MLHGENGKIVSDANYYFNTDIDQYCIVGTTYCSESLRDLEEMFESPELLHEVPMPDSSAGDVW